MLIKNEKLAKKVADELGLKVVKSRFEEGYFME